MEEKSKNIVHALTSRDSLVLLMIYTYRFVRTGQVKQLIFPELKDLQVARRRLKRLYEAGLVDYIEITQSGRGAIERVHFLTEQGAQFIEENHSCEKILPYNRPKRLNFPYMEHGLECSQFRIHLELAAKNHPMLELAQFVSEHEIKSNYHTQKMRGNARYKLYHQFQHPYRKDAHYTVLPDGAFVLRGRGEFSGDKILFFLEVDRGTENLEIIRQKLVGYEHYRKSKLHKEEYKVTDFTTIFVCPSLRRAKSIRQAITDLQESLYVWTTAKTQITEKTILTDSIYLNWEDKEQPILAV